MNTLFIDILRGLHYKIPLCCIIQWCMEEHFPQMMGKRKHPKQHYAVNDWFWDARISLGYIPCSLCLQKFYQANGRLIGPEQERDYGVKIK